MSDTPLGTTLSSIPVELRLVIAMFVFQETQDLRLIYGEADHGNKNTSNKLYTQDVTHKSAPGLSLLLVCRQFRRDFTRLAYEQTALVVRSELDERINRLPDDLLKYTRKLVIPFAQLELLQCQKNPRFFIRDCLRLDELFVVPHTWNDKAQTKSTASYLRHLENVKTIHFVLQDSALQTHRNNCYSLIGAILKEDHYQRYDAPHAPHIETTWWDWSYDRKNQVFTFSAQQSRPIMQEELYMVSVKPLIDGLMEGLTS